MVPVYLNKHAVICTNCFSRQLLWPSLLGKHWNLHINQSIPHIQFSPLFPQVRKANPEKSCFLQYDKLYIDSKIFVYNEVLGQVVEHTESVRYG